MASSFTEIRKRQLARLGGAKPPSARAAMARAKSAGSNGTLSWYA